MALSLLAVAVWLWRARETQGPVNRPLVHENPGTLPPAATMLADGIDPSDPGNAESTSQRTEAIVPYEIAGTIRDSNGYPIPDAEVSLTLGSGGTRLLPPRSMPWAEIDAGTHRTVTDEHGVFELQLGVASQPSSATWHLWTTKPGFAPVHSDGSLTELARQPISIELPRHAAYTVHVVDSADRPAKDARVDYYSDAILLSRRGLASRVTDGLHVFHRWATTDSAGEVRFAQPIEAGLVVASLGAMQSDEAPIEANASPLRLQLCPSFSVAGVVRLPQSPTPGLGARVDIGDVYEGENYIYGSMAIGPDGLLAATRWPILGSDSVYAQFIGPPFQSLRREIGSVAAGQSLWLEFDPVIGTCARVEVFDETGTPVGGAIVKATWATPDGAVDYSDQWRTSVDGVAMLHGLAPGWVSVDIAKPGFASKVAGPIDLEAQQFGQDCPAIRIVLTALARLDGRVLHLGNPVSDFEIVTWPLDASEPQCHAFAGRDDGGFVLENLPRAWTRVCARSPDLPASDILRINLQDPPSEPIVLQLPEACFGHGVFVDADTHAPVEGVRVQPWTYEDMTPVLPWGEAVVSDVNGEFRVRGFSEGTNRIVHQSAEHGVGLARADVVRGGEADFGVVPLFKPHDVVVMLRANDDRDLAQYTGEIKYGSGRLPRTASTSGLITFEDCYPTKNGIAIGRPDRWNDLVEAVCLAGDDWRLPFQVDGPVSLAVEIVASDRQPLPDTWTLNVEYLNETGWQAVRSREFGAESAVIVRDLPPGPITVVVRSAASGWVLGTARMDLTTEPEQVVRVELGVHDKQLRFLDLGGTPIPPCSVTYWCAEDSLPHRCDGRTAPDGTIWFPAAHCDRWVVNFRGELLISGLHVDLDSDSNKVQDVFLPPLVTLSVRLLDGDEPLAGVSCWIEELTSHFPIDPANTSAAGVARWQSVNEANYEVVIGGQGLWRTRAVVRASADEDVQTVQARRVGSCVFLAVDREGHPIAGAEVDLTYVELGEDVSDWIEQGRMKSPPGGLLTDAEGRLPIAGIPRGEYEWRVHWPDGGVENGTLTVVAGAKREVSVERD